MSSTANSVAGVALCLTEEEVRGDAEQEVLRLFLLMRRPLLQYALSFGGAPSDAEDVVQESFLALFDHLRRGRSRENLRAWLFRVTHHQALKKRMKDMREVPGLEAEETQRADTDPNPQECMLAGERQARMQDVLRALPLNDQLCLRLRAEGLTYREIAKIVGISLGSVSASLTRSLLRLQAVDGRHA